MSLLHRINPRSVYAILAGTALAFLFDINESRARHAGRIAILIAVIACIALAWREFRRTRDQGPLAAARQWINAAFWLFFSFGLSLTAIGLYSPGTIERGELVAIFIIIPILSLMLALVCRGVYQALALELPPDASEPRALELPMHARPPKAPRIPAAAASMFILASLGLATSINSCGKLEGNGLQVATAQTDWYAANFAGPVAHPATITYDWTGRVLYWIVLAFAASTVSLLLRKRFGQTSPLAATRAALALGFISIYFCLEYLQVTMAGDIDNGPRSGYWFAGRAVVWLLLSALLWRTHSSAAIRRHRALKVLLAVFLPVAMLAIAQLFLAAMFAVYGLVALLAGAHALWWSWEIVARSQRAASHFDVRDNDGREPPPKARAASAT